jgi:hypothetical protein
VAAVRRGDRLPRRRARRGARRGERGLAVGANAEWQARRGSAPPFDGLAEIHFSGSAPEFFAALEAPGPKACFERLEALQEELVDVPRSCFFLASQDAEASFSVGEG